MFASYLIGLREGLEATLVVTILVAFLVKSGRRHLLRLVWVGVAVAVLASLLVAAGLTYVWANLDTFRQQELFEAIISLVAVAFVTWMIFWMRRAARTIKNELQAKLDEAVAIGPVAVAVVGFVAVAREGLETAVLFLGAAQGAGNSPAPLAGLALGVATAIGLGVLLYLGALRVNLGHFFTWTGVLLIFVAAGILRYGIHDFQEAGVLGGMNAVAFDVSAYYDEQSWYGSLITGMFNFVAAPSWLEVIGYLAYLVPVLLLFLWPRRAAGSPARTDGGQVETPAQS
ncbi:MAG: iron transporter [Streptosporangiales bacterium]|nr:iron transporter [Streptosporangiales bacterium]